MTTEDLYVHYLTEDLLDACGQAPRGVKVAFTHVIEDVTCRACRDKVRPTLHARIEAHVERTNVINALTAMLEAWEMAIDKHAGPGFLNDLRRAGDAYVEALAAFIDSRAKAAVLSLREPSKVVAPPFTGGHE